MPFIILKVLYFLYSASTYYFSVFAILQFYITEAKVKLPDNVTISAIFTFGDSILDTGNNNNLETVAKCNFPPYGRDFMGGKPTGRFCNGKVPSDIIVEELGIKELLPAYLDLDLQNEEFLRGVNFASGGTGYDPLTSELVSAIPLTKQLELFKEYMKKVKEAVGEERARNITANSINVVSVSSDDIVNTYFLFPTRMFEYNISAYTDLLASSASVFLEGLYEMGPRMIGVLSAPPLGCLPFSRTLRGGNCRNCVESFDEAAKLFNCKLKQVLDNLNRKHHLAKFVYVDIYTILNEIIQNPKKYGFEIANRGCCGTGTYEVAIMCNEWSPFTCSNASEYVFWDSYHPTERAYRVIISHLLQDLISHFFSQ